MLTFLVLLILGCDGGKSDETGEVADTAAPGESAAEMPDYSGCTLTESVYDGPDGVLQEETVTVYGHEEREVSVTHQDLVEGTWYEGASVYNEAGCATNRTYASGAEDVVQYSSDSTYICNDDGTWSEAESLYSWLDDGEVEPSVWTQTTEWTYEWADDQIVSTHQLVTHEDGYLVQEILVTSDWEGSLELHREFASSVLSEEMKWTIYDWDYDDSGWLTRFDRLTSDGVSYRRAYSRDALGRTSQIAYATDGAAVGTRTYRWDPDHYRLQQETWDAGDDGALEEQDDYVCSGDWPWSCGVSVDVGDDDGGPIDGAFDSFEVQTWTCPG